MNTYTLAEVDFLNAQGPDRVRNRNILQSLSISDDALMAIAFSDSLRQKNVVGLYHGYGSHYAKEIHMYLEASLKDSLVSESSTRRYTLGELAWINSTGMFSGDMCKEIVSLGYPSETGDALAKACRDTKNDVVRWWMTVREDYSDAAQNYLEHELKSYPPAWPHNDVAEPSMSM